MIECLFDPEKDKQNRKKHGVSLALGRDVMLDPHVLQLLDSRFDYGEERWNGFGLVNSIVYVATYTEKDEGARFISVRQATKREAEFYYRANDKFNAIKAEENAIQILQSKKYRAQQTAQILSSSILTSTDAETRCELDPLECIDPIIDELYVQGEDTLLVGHMPYLGKLLGKLIPWLLVKPETSL